MSCQRGFSECFPELSGRNPKHIPPAMRAANSQYQDGQPLAMTVDVEKRLWEMSDMAKVLEDCDTAPAEA
jgi:hypothetical protein